MTVQILRPNAGETDYSVVVTDTTDTPNSGMICARASWDGGNNQRRWTGAESTPTTPATIPAQPNHEGDAQTAVLAAVFSSLDAAQAVTAATKGVQGYPDDPNDDIYFFPCIPQTVVGPSPGAANYLAVWVVTSGVVVDGPATCAFSGISACATECEVGNGLGGGGGAMATVRAATNKTTPVHRGTCSPRAKGAAGAVSLIAKLWTVVVPKTGGPVMDDNFPLPLKAIDLDDTSTPRGQTTWRCNAPTGGKWATVTMQCATFHPDKIDLVFTPLDSKAPTLKYSRHIVGWYPQGANALFLEIPRWNPDLGVPPYVMIYPG